MDKYDFIRQLEVELKGLSDDEINSAISYYKELFEDAGSDKAQELINNLGSPKEIAESIKRESGTIIVNEEIEEPKQTNESIHEENSNSNQENNSKSKQREVSRDGGTILLLVIILILTSPVWLGLLIAFYSIIFALVCTVLVIALAFGAIGICGIISGITTIFSIPPVGLVLLGMGLLFTALTLICAPPLCKGLFLLCRGVLNGTIAVFRSIFYKKEAVAA